MDEKMKERIINALVRTWNAIGDDALTDAGQYELPRVEVVELVLDGGRAEMYGGDEQAIAELRRLPVDEQYKLATEAFPYEYYGR